MDDSDQDHHLNISLLGQGRRPSCQLLNEKEIENSGILDLGVIQLGETAEQVLIMRNTSNFDINFRLYLASEMNQMVSEDQNDMVNNVLFDCSPSDGTVIQNDEIKLKVRFTPEHGGSFKDSLCLQLSGRDCKKGMS
jgi:hypothetical protein